MRKINPFQWHPTAVTCPRTWRHFIAMNGREFLRHLTAVSRQLNMRHLTALTCRTNCGRDTPQTREETERAADDNDMVQARGYARGILSLFNTFGDHDSYLHRSHGYDSYENRRRISSESDIINKVCSCTHARSWEHQDKILPF